MSPVCGSCAFAALLCCSCPARLGADAGRDAALLAITAIAHYLLGERGTPALERDLRSSAGNRDPAARHRSGRIRHDRRRPRPAHRSGRGHIGDRRRSARRPRARWSRQPARLLLLGLGFLVTWRASSSHRAVPRFRLMPLAAHHLRLARDRPAAGGSRRACRGSCSASPAIGRAHRAERQASEAEAQRRQDARLLHDTVLATLTLLAHSGVGVSPDALRQQAGDDARLLRQLRLGGLPTPRVRRRTRSNRRPNRRSATPSNRSSSASAGWASRSSWHGSGQVLLPSDVLDAFLLALGECLENVRRHSGVDRGRRHDHG